MKPISALKKIRGKNVYKKSMMGKRRWPKVLLLPLELVWWVKTHYQIGNYKGPPQDAPADLTPWFQHAEVELPKDRRVIFGHWAALGFFKMKMWSPLIPVVCGAGRCPHLM